MGLVENFLALGVISDGIAILRSAVSGWFSYDEQSVRAIVLSVIMLTSAIAMGAGPAVATAGDEIESTDGFADVDDNGGVADDESDDGSNNSTDDDTSDEEESEQDEDSGDESDTEDQETDDGDDAGDESDESESDEETDPESSDETDESETDDEETDDETESGAGSEDEQGGSDNAEGGDSTENSDTESEEEGETTDESGSGDDETDTGDGEETEDEDAADTGDDESVTDDSESSDAEESEDDEHADDDTDSTTSDNSDSEDDAEDGEPGDSEAAEDGEYVDSADTDDEENTSADDDDSGADDGADSEDAAGENTTDDAEPDSEGDSLTTVVYSFQEDQVVDRYEASDAGQPTDLNQTNVEASEDEVSTENDDPRERIDAPWETDNIEPYRATAQISSSYGDDEVEVGGCTGVLVNRSHVLTAAHCVYDQDEEWANNVTVTLAADEIDGNGVYPYSTADVQIVRTYDEYIEEDLRRHDFALLTLDRPLGESDKTATVDWQAYDRQDAVYQGPIFTQGYPVEPSGILQEFLFTDPPESPQPYPTMWFDSGIGQGEICRVAGDCVAESIDASDLTASAGQSGSGIFRYDSNSDEYEIIGVMAEEDPQPVGSDILWGPRITHAKSNDLYEWTSKDQSGKYAPGTKPEYTFDGPRFGSGFDPDFDATYTGGGFEIEYETKIRNVGTSPGSSDLNVTIIAYDAEKHGSGFDLDPENRYIIDSTEVPPPEPFDTAPVSFSTVVSDNISDELETNEISFLATLSSEDDEFERVKGLPAAARGIARLDSEFDQNQTLSTLTIPDYSMEIKTVQGSAGGVERPRPVSAQVNIEADGDAYNEDISGDEFGVTVGGQTVDSEVTVTRNRPGIYTLYIVPPEQDDPGEYNLSIEFLGETADTQSDTIRYSEGETTQVAASLQIDRSGSMRGIMDEARRGANAFVASAGDEDYISLVSYSGSSTTNYELKRMTGDETTGNEADLRAEIDGLSASGGTNTGDAIDDGFLTIEDAPEGTEKAGIHMTDGRQNTGPSESQILNEIVPKYNENDACLYTIGFTSGADERFMQEVAEASDCGTYEFAAESGEADAAEATLQEVFSDIATDVSDDSLLYQESGTVTDTTVNRFNVDDSVVRTSVSVQLDGIDLSGPASIQGPAFYSGASSALQITTSNDAPSVTLFDSDGNAVDPEANDDVEQSVVGDTITFQIDDPAPGEWSYEIENSGSEDVDYEAQVTGATQTTMDVSTAADTYYAGGETDLTTTVIGPDGPLEDATVTADVEVPSASDETITFTEESSGLYTASVDVDTNGTYTATVTADGDDVTRTESISWSVKETPPLSIDQSMEPSVVQGTSESFDVTLDREFGGDPEEITIDAVSINTDDGTATLPDSAINFETQVTEVAPDDSETVQATITVAENAVPSDYEGTIRAFREDGSVVTESVEFTVLQDATFEPRIDGTNGPVPAGETLELEATVENTGEETATQTVELLNFDGNVVSDESVSLDPGEEASVTLFASLNEAGSDAVTVQTDDDAVTTTVEVLRTSEFTTDDVNVPEELSTGDTLTVDANVSNLGDIDGEATIELRVNGTVVDTDTATIDAGTDRSVTLTADLGSDEVGDDVPVTVGVGDDSISQSIDITDDRDENGSPGGGGGSSGGGGVSLAPGTTTPSFSASTSISDAAPDAPGTTVDVGQANVESITVDDDEAYGSVTVTEFDGMPAQTPALDDDRPAIATVGIDVPDAQADSAATLEFTIDADDVAAADADADELVVLRAADDATDYEELATDATELNGEIVVEAETPGFSTFVVSATDDPAETSEPDEKETPTPEPDEEETSTPEPDEEKTPEEPGAFETPGFGVVVALVALLAAALIAARRTR